MREGTNNIVTLPSTASTDVMAEYYIIVDVFVLLSLAENYATAALESMTCGTSVAGFDAGGILEQLTDRKGIAVPTGDQEAFDETIRQALRSDNELHHGEELADYIWMLIHYRNTDGFSIPYIRGLVGYSLSCQKLQKFVENRLWCF